MKNAAMQVSQSRITPPFSLVNTYFIFFGAVRSFERAAPFCFFVSLRGLSPRRTHKERMKLKEVKT